MLRRETRGSEQKKKKVVSVRRGLAELILGTFPRKADRAWTSSVLVSMRPKEFSIKYSAKGKKGKYKSEQSRVRKSCWWWNAWPPTQMQRLIMTLHKTVTIWQKYRRNPAVNWLAFDLYTEQTSDLPSRSIPLWRQREQIAVFAVLAITSSSMLSCPIAWPFRGFYKLASPWLFNTGIKE